MPFSKLIKGFLEFQTQYFKKDTKLYKDLMRGAQAPVALVIACSDSRNDPALIMQSKPGDLFVVRNVAAIVPPYQPDSNYHGTSAAIEFAVRTLKVKNIIVLGHALCSGIDALAGETVEFPGCSEFVSHWISIGAEARDAVEKGLPDAAPGTKLRALEQAVILTSLNNLMTFPWISEAVKSGECALHGWYFDMLDGTLLGYDPKTGFFREIDAEGNMFGTDANTPSGALSIDYLLKNYA